MEIPLYQIDAFADRPFSGNPAAVCPLNQWLPDETLQAIAAENNLSETAFFVPLAGHDSPNSDNPDSNSPENDSLDKDSPAHFQLRWFTPTTEVDLCGHATLATAFALFDLLGFPGEDIRFATRSGTLVVTRASCGLKMDFPALAVAPTDMPEQVVGGALGAIPDEAWQGSDLLLVYASQQQIEALTPDFRSLAKLPYRGIIATAPGEECDFVSRFFAPASGIDEDPVTGSAHCVLTPFWAERLGKQVLSASQLSPRGGTLTCELTEERVLLTGNAICYLKGTIHLPPR
ncbi:MAG: PhzF family phenazine biosynthesis protein [Porticoccaceae bacterium]